MILGGRLRCYESVVTRTRVVNEGNSPILQSCWLLYVCDRRLLRIPY